MIRSWSWTRALPAGAILLGACAQEPASVDVQPKNIEFSRKGETKPLTATARDRAGQAIASAQFTWSSQDPAVATVDANGTVTAVASGKTSILAQAGKASGQAAAVVAIPARIEVQPAEVLLRGAGQSQQLAASVFDEKGGAIPAAGVQWSSDNPGVATIAGTTVTAVADGQARLTARAGEAVATVLVTVRGPQATTIRVTPNPLVLKAGKSQQLTAGVLDDSGQPMPDSRPSWTSADPAIASVSDTGLVTGVKRGNTTVSAVIGQAKDEVQVSIK